MQKTNKPITNGSTCCPAQLYHGGRPAVYIVRLFARIIDSVASIVLVKLIDVVRWRRCLGDRSEPVNRLFMEL